MAVRPYIRDGNVVYPLAWRRPQWRPEPWRWWFAWWPVRVDGRLVWLRRIAWRRSWHTDPIYDLLGDFRPWRIEYAPRLEEQEGGHERTRRARA
jgi:hypothetical protein